MATRAIVRDRSVIVKRLGTDGLQTSGHLPKEIGDGNGSGGDSALMSAE